MKKPIDCKSKKDIAQLDIPQLPIDRDAISISKNIVALLSDPDDEYDSTEIEFDRAYFDKIVRWYVTGSPKA